ncbi:MAG: YqaJ viral recombinase family protein [Microbacteriaceae bacterium]
MSYLDRVLADSYDRESWLKARENVLGASDAAKFAKISSVETYVRQKLTKSEFTGNSATEQGNRWEPMLLAYAQFDPCGLLIHHPDEAGFAATPDGLHVRGDGSLQLAETKAKHNIIVTGPNPRELRQIAWQLFVVPEATSVDFIWGEIVDKSGEWELRRDPQIIRYWADSDIIRDIQAQIVPIATEVLAALKAARELEKEIDF